MGKYLNPGNTAFQISLDDDIYIDKSSLISFVNSRIGKRKRYICVSRPRRFGKSMTAEMLSAYYNRKSDSEALFQNLKIAEDISYKQHLNKYDVLFLNIQHFLRKAGTPGNLPQYIEERVLAELKEIYSGFIGENEQSLPEALASIFERDTSSSKGFIFIIDEWDCIFRETQNDKEAQRKYLDFLKDLFKDRTYVKVAYMTGILPIKKYGTHSALNIFDEFSMTDAKGLAEYVGFTEQEVKRLCESYEMDFEKARHWYDGYQFKNVSHIYNPKSIVDAMLEKDFRSYWNSTETYEALQVYIDLNYDGLKDAVVIMIGGGKYKIDTGAFQNDMTSLKSKDDVLTLMVHLGYLAFNELTQEVFIPNEEVREEFIRAIKNGDRKELVKAITQSDRLLEATLRQDADEVAQSIDEIHSAATSQLCYNSEVALAGVIQLAYYSAKDDYLMVRELPAGKGFADIVFLPRKNSDKPALIVELKWNKSAEGAIAQIKNRQYVKAIENYGGEILLVGINYDKESKSHQCIIEKFV